MAFWLFQPASKPVARSFWNSRLASREFGPFKPELDKGEAIIQDLVSRTFYFPHDCHHLSPAQADFFAGTEGNSITLPRSVGGIHFTFGRKSFGM